MRLLFEKGAESSACSWELWALLLPSLPTSIIPDNHSDLGFGVASAWEAWELEIDKVLSVQTISWDQWKPNQVATGTRS
jgi:hypothetical protein